MTQAPAAPTFENKEIWELTTGGRVAVLQFDAKGQERTLTVRGKGQRLRVTKSERELCEERIRDKQNNPFRNGKLLWINRDTSAVEEADQTPGEQELADSDLAALFEAEDQPGFEAAVKELSEVNVRRLKELANDASLGAKAYQVVFIDEYIHETWPIGGDTPTYREMQQVPVNATS